MRFPVVLLALLVPRTSGSGLNGSASAPAVQVALTRAVVNGPQGAGVKHIKSFKIDDVADVRGGLAGAVVNIPAGADLQAALDAAKLGDTLQLAAGATYVGNFILAAAPASSTGTWLKR
jgi:hypothetical protein